MTAPHTEAEAQAILSRNTGKLAPVARVARRWMSVAATLHQGFGTELPTRNCDPLQGRVPVPETRKPRLVLRAVGGRIRRPGAGWTSTLQGKSHA